MTEPPERQPIVLPGQLNLLEDGEQQLAAELAVAFTRLQAPHDADNPVCGFCGAAGFIPGGENLAGSSDSSNGWICLDCVMEHIIG